MNETEFTELLQSVREAKQILRGEQKASREFVVEVPAATAQPSTSYVLCVQADDLALLTPRKIYLTTYSQSDLVRVVDEAGESALYPKDFFVPIALPKEIEAVLEKVAA